MNLVKLIDERDLVKICPKCGKKYLKNDNFCGIHDAPIKLSYIKDLVKRCKACGAEYPEDYNYCIKCEWDEPLEVFSKPRPHIDEIRQLKYNPNKRYNFKKHQNNFTEFNDLLSDENINLLKEFNFTQLQFDTIIQNITNTSKMIMEEFITKYNIYMDKLYISEKILLYAKTFVKTEYKQVNTSNYGYYGYNTIYVQDIDSDPYEIITIIHELSHFLLSEILEQIISEILNTDKTDALEALVYHILHKDIFNKVVDEYCAHTVEARFENFAYQDYGSYLDLLNEFAQEYSKKHLNIAKTIGNTFAIYIKSIIESFITAELRNEIKYELRKSDLKKTNDFQYATDKKHNWNKFRQAIKIILTKNIDQIMYNPKDLEKLENARMKFSENNK